MDSINRQQSIRSFDGSVIRVVCAGSMWTGVAELQVFSFTLSYSRTAAVIISGMCFFLFLSFRFMKQQTNTKVNP